jgi:hypothetical protein
VVETPSVLGMVRYFPNETGEPVKNGNVEKTRRKKWASQREKTLTTEEKDVLQEETHLI